MDCNHAFWRQDDLCYFCRKEKKWKDITLADGCIVPACGVCYTMIEDGRKLAQERGYYDPKRMGGDKMKAEKYSEGGNFLKVKDVQDNKITELKIVGDVTTVTFDKTKDGKTIQVVKYQGEVSYDNMNDNSPNIWTMNHPSSNALIDAWGDDTSNWKDKIIPLTIAGEGEYKHFKVDSLRIK